MSLIIHYETLSTLNTNKSDMIIIKIWIKGRPYLEMMLNNVASFVLLHLQTCITGFTVCGSLCNCLKSKAFFSRSESQRRCFLIRMNHNSDHKNKNKKKTDLGAVMATLCFMYLAIKTTTPLWVFFFFYRL